MNQGRIWCVVHPTVGLPLFIGGVAVTSLVVHASIMTNTTWMSSYWQGAKAKSAMIDQAPAGVAENSAFSVTISPKDGAVASGYTVTVTPKAGVVASADPVTSGLENKLVLNTLDAK